MRTSARWLGIAAFLLLSATAGADNVLKPYVVMLLDTSGSMNNSTSAGPPTCGGRDNRLNHARCAINRIVNSYGDMVFALGRFRMTAGGSYSTSCDANGDVDGTPGTPDQCTAGGDGCTRGDGGGEMLTGLVDGGNNAASVWTDFTCSTCGGAGTALSAQPELWAADGSTPIGGTLQSAHRYWRGLALATDNSVIYTQNVCAGGTNAGAPCTNNTPCTGGGTCSGAHAGWDPIRSDPTKNAFLPNGCDPAPTCTMNCCTKQCRSYITIMLTDGQENCSGNAETVAAGMLATDIDNKLYRIETKVIGFGVTPGDPDIERYAHGGGAADLPGVNEGYYVNDEASLQLALSQILADAVKVETCNNQDDDCDGNIDEDFLPPKSIPGKNGTCNNGQLGVCARTGSLQCRSDGAGLECNAQTITPGVETQPCNGLDDDCDGRIDENLGCTQCIPTGEICDGNDNDCDGVADQVCRCSNNINTRCDDASDCGGAACDCAPLTRPCGTGSCTGTEKCTAPNTYTECTAATPDPNGESCDGADNDCDGVCDGITLECSDQVTLGGPGTDSKGHPMHNPPPIAQNICRPGLKTCAIGCGPGPKSFSACSGETLPCDGQIPCTDPCNGVDDDCDNSIDEDFAPADCSTNCGLGQTVCTNGAITCNSVMAGVDNNCNGQDEDCDGKFDEGWVCGTNSCVGGTNAGASCTTGNAGTVCTGGGTCTGVCTGPDCCKCGTGTTCELNQCISGSRTCVVDPAINPEVCNCLDDDCDGIKDNGTNSSLCPGGGDCVNCQCAFNCTNDEFPCPLGKRCEMTQAGNYCVNDPCFNVTCPVPGSGNAQTCIPKPNFPNEPLCVDTCSLVNDGDTMHQPPCPPGQVCVGGLGECRPDDCSTFPDRCTANQKCIAGTCVTNPCQGVTCDGATYCVGGECVASCSDLNCGAGKRCRMGVCEDDPCDKACPFGQACNDSTGECIEDPCKFRECPTGQWCNPNDGQCEEDPCVSSGVSCPNAGDLCRGGSCIDPTETGPDAGSGAFVTVGGGGCNTGGSNGGFLLALGVMGLLLSRRRRTVGGAQ